MRPKKQIAIGAVLCCVTHAALDADRASSQTIYYNNAARTVFERFVSDPTTNGLGWWEGGNIVPLHRITAEEKDRFFDEFTSAELRDCSDAKHRCAYGVYKVFAVPRGGLEPLSTYTAGGAVFRIEKCLRGDQKRCQVALISSDCQSQIQPDRCVEAPGGRASSSAPGRIGYFIFNEDIGITAYGSAKEPAPTAEARLAAALDMVLRGDKGPLGR